MHWRRNGNPLQYSCLENPRDGGAWWAAVFGVTQSRTRLKRLSSSSSSPQVSHLLGWQGYKILMTGDFPGSPMIKTLLPIQGAQVRFLLGKLRSHMPATRCSQKQKNENKHRWGFLVLLGSCFSPRQPRCGRMWVRILGTQFHPPQRCSCCTGGSTDVGGPISCCLCGCCNGRPQVAFPSACLHLLLL